MYDRQQRESLAPSVAHAASAQRPTDAVEAGPQQKAPDEEREEQWGQRLRGLQEWICELLIQNQELRMSLQDLATNHQFRETDQ
jgi:hypothetical protein